MRIHKGAGVALRVLGGMVAVLCLLVGLTITLAKTRWGGERLRRFALDRVNQEIQGHLDIGRLSFGGDRLIVWGVQLRDPEGGFVASTARAEVDVALLRLVRHELRIEAVAIDAPVLDLVAAPAGTNLARAIAPRKATPPEPPAPKTTGEGWVIRVDRFALNGGALTMATGGATHAETRLHLTDLRSFITARYATGNGNLDLTVRLDGQSVQAPTGPLELSAETHRHGQALRLTADGVLLGGTLLARANLDGEQLAAAEAHLDVDLPALALAGQSWGPLRIEGKAQPGAIPNLTVRLDLPGVTLRGNGGGAPGAVNSGSHAGRFDFTARLSLADLGLTAKALSAVTGGPPAPVDGRGTIDLALGGPMVGAPASWSGEVKANVPRLVWADTTVTALALIARAARLERDAPDATLALAVEAVHAGKTAFRGIDVSGAWRAGDVTVGAKLTGPEPVHLALAARLDGDRKGLTLTRMNLTFPGADWALDTAALVRVAGDTVSLDQFRLTSRGQALAIDGRKEGDSIAAHVALERLRLEELPALLVDPALHLGGVLGVDVKASGTTSAPRVVAAVRLQQGRAGGFTKLGVKADATLASRRAEGTLEVDAPFAAAAVRFALPVDLPQVRDSPFDVRLDVTRLNVGEALRAAAVDAHADGRLTAGVHLDGSLGDPHLEATVKGTELQVGAPAAAKAAIDLGHARLQVTYARKQARADLDFASHGGTLRAEAAAHVDLSYPRVTERLVVPKIPIEGKVLAKDLDVAWLAQFSDRVQTLGGQLNADAKLAGTVGAPRFIGDVRWKNGQLITTAAARPTQARASAGRARHTGP